MSSAMERRQASLKPQSTFLHASEEQPNSGEDACAGARDGGQGGGAGGGGGSVGGQVIPEDLESRLQRMEAMISSVHAAVMGGGSPARQQERRLEQMEAMISSVHAAVAGGRASDAEEVAVQEGMEPGKTVAAATPDPAPTSPPAGLLTVTRRNLPGGVSPDQASQLAGLVARLTPKPSLEGGLGSSALA